MSGTCSKAERPTVSVVIPCYNGKAYVETTLQKVLQQSVPPLEVIFIDDGSTDGSGDLARKFPVRFIANDSNRGLAYTRNSAINIAEGEVILFLDIDTWPDERLVELLGAEFRDPALAAVGGRGIEVNIQNCYDQFRSRFFSQGLGLKRIENPGVLFGLCSAYRKNVLKELNGFDPEFRTNGEDFDLAFRLRRRGHKIVYHPDCVVYHHRHDEPDSFYRLVYRWFYWGGRAYQKNRKVFFIPFLFKITWDLIRHCGFALGHHPRLIWLAIGGKVARLRLYATLDLRLGRGCRV